MSAPGISLVPQRCDLALYAGDGCAIKLKLSYRDGTPYPLDGVVTAQIRSTRNEPDPPAATFTVDDSAQADGVATISLSGADTAALVNGGTRFTGAWDVQFNPTGGEPVTLMQGKTECSADVTRP